MNGDHSTKPIRIIFADDHEVVREGYLRIFGNEPQMEVLGVATNGKELVEMVAALDPDLVFTDIMMPVMDGIAATQAIRQMKPQLPIIAFTVFEDEFKLKKILKAGAMGYLAKTASREELLQAARVVLEGFSYFCSTMSVMAARSLARTDIPFRFKKGRDELKENDLTIICHMCAERTSKEIANLMNISVRSVETSRAKIMKNIGASTVAGVILYAVYNGIYEDPKYGPLHKSKFSTKKSGE